MATHEENNKSIKSDTREIESQDERFSAFIIDRYRERFVTAEREKKVLLNRLTAITKGKRIILESKRRPVGI